MIQAQRLLLLAILFIWFVMPLISNVWQSIQLPWYAAFVLWFLAIVPAMIAKER